MKADGVALHDVKKEMNSGAPRSAMAKRLLPCCLPCRKARAGQEARHDVRHGTRGIVGRLLFFCRRHLKSAFAGEADIIRQAKPAELVENDPDRTWSECALCHSNEKGDCI